MPRVIFSLKLTVTADGVTELIAPLDHAGQSPYIVPCPPKKRAIDLRVGDHFDHRGTRRQVFGIQAYRDVTWEGESELPDSGYLVRRFQPCPARGA